MNDLIYLPKAIIDPHGHWRDFGHSQKTTIIQYLWEAKRAGIGISFGMPNTQPSIIGNKSLEDQLTKLEKAEIELKLEYAQYVYFGATDDNFDEAKIALTHSRVIGVKIYPKVAGGSSVTTGSGIGVAFDASIAGHMIITRNADKAIAAHCEHPDMIDPARDYYPKEAEVEYVKKIISVARSVPGVKIVICHPSCRESVELIEAAQKEGLRIAYELVAHYLWFDSQRTNWNQALHPFFYNCLNRLRTTDDMMFLRSRLKIDNDLVFVASDSACHAAKEKLQGASGIPSNQEMIPVILTLAREMNVPNQRVIRLLCLNAARFFNIPVSSKMVPYRLEKRFVTSTYNNGEVVNPWTGSELCFPVPLSNRKEK